MSPELEHHHQLFCCVSGTQRMVLGRSRHNQSQMPSVHLWKQKKQNTKLDDKCNKVKFLSYVSLSYDPLTYPLNSPDSYMYSLQPEGSYDQRAEIVAASYDSYD